MPPDIVYEPLFDIVSFEDFPFQKREIGEEEKLKPQLIRLGYTNIEFSSNHDGYFEPNTRICRCIDPNGNPRRFYYG